MECRWEHLEDSWERRANLAAAPMPPTPPGADMELPLMDKQGPQNPCRPPRSQNRDFSIFYGCFRGLECLHSLPRPSDMNFAIVNPHFPLPRSDSDHISSISDKCESLNSELFSKKVYPIWPLRRNGCKENDPIKCGPPWSVAKTIGKSTLSLKSRLRLTVLVY